MIIVSKSDPISILVACKHFRGVSTCWKISSWEFKWWALQDERISECCNGKWEKGLVWSLVNTFIRGGNAEKWRPAKSLFPALWLWQQHDDNKIPQFGSCLSSSHTPNVTLENQIAPIKSNQTDCRTAINSKDNDKGSHPKVSLPQLVSHCTVDAEDGWKKNKLSCRESEGERKR